MTRVRSIAFASVVLATLGLAALAATQGLPFHKAVAASTACSSCDARHQPHLRLMEQRAAEITP
jgi:hypothetical protein